MSLTLYFLRHGQTALSRADVFCGSGLDPDLTAEGVEMAQAFAAAYQTKSWAAIYCSTLRRGISTAEPIRASLGLTARTTPDLNEIAYGKWEGLTKEKVEQDYPVEYRNWLADPAWHAPTGGETAVAVAERGLDSIAEIKKDFSDGEVLLVSHKATIRILLCQLLGIDLAGFRNRLGCPVGSVSMVEFGSQGPMLRVLADRSHLSDRLKNLPGT